MKYLYTIMLLFAWVGVCAQSSTSTVQKHPVTSISVGSNVVAFGKEDVGWNPTHRAAVGVGLAVSHKTRGTITPRVGLTTDAIRTVFQGANINGPYEATITKRYWGARMGVEYDYALSCRWFVGGILSLAFAQMYGWEVERNQLPQPKPVSRTIEEELDDITNGMMTFWSPQLVLGYIYSENIAFRFVASYESGAKGSGWRYSLPREKTISINLSVQYAFK